MVEVSVDHGQFAVALCSIESPFPDWQQHHSDQGFALLPGAASFGTLRNTTSLQLEVEIGGATCGSFAPEAVRVIQVPFEVPEDDDAQIVTITTQETIGLPPGLYTLQVEQWLDDNGDGRGRLLFCPGASEACVLKADEDVTRTTDLVLTADWA